MLATYGVDILAPDVSLRRVKLLADRLPRGAWPDTSHPASWSTEAYLIAQLIDEIAALHYTTVRAHGAKPTRPKPFPRPKATPRRPAAAPRSGERVSWAALADQLAGSTTGQVVVHGGDP